MLPPQAAATRQIDNLEDIDWTTSPGTPKLRSATYQAPDHPAQVEVVPGGLSTAGINYQLIPPIVWERGAKRFMLGEERKGDKAWNADSLTSTSSPTRNSFSTVLLTQWLTLSSSWTRFVTTKT